MGRRGDPGVAAPPGRGHLCSVRQPAVPHGAARAHAVDRGDATRRRGPGARGADALVARAISPTITTALPVVTPHRAEPRSVVAVIRPTRPRGSTQSWACCSW